MGCLNGTRRVGLPEKVWVTLSMTDGEFNYAGELDELTGKRFGFHYPLEQCRAKIRIETNISTPLGLAIRLERSCSGMVS